MEGRPRPVKTNDELYEEARTLCGAALRRMARGYEADAELQRDLLQDIHVELWRSLRLFDGRCSLKTWVYRVAHNVAASHILSRRRVSAPLVELGALKSEPVFVDGETRANQGYAVSQMLERIHRLGPVDRQVMLLYLEGESGGEIAEVTGLSASNVATKIHRIKTLLHRQITEGGKA
jgi:RNA polymerase sigma-70 factor (ECF subfamily)